MNLRVAEVGRELDRAGRDHAGRGPGQHRGKRRRAAGESDGVEAIGGTNEEALIAFGGAGLGERGFDGGVFSAAVVHAVAEAEHGPVVLRATDGEADARSPVVAQAGQLLSQRQIGIQERGERRRHLLAVPAQSDGKHGEFGRLPLRGDVAGQVAGAETPVGGAHGLRIVGVAGQRPESSRGGVAVVRVLVIKEVCQAEFFKGQRVADEVLDF